MNTIATKEAGPTVPLGQLSSRLRPSSGEIIIYTTRIVDVVLPNQ